MARRTLGADEGPVEDRDLPPPGLSVAPLARQPGAPRALGARSSTSTTSTWSSRGTTTRICGPIRSAGTAASAGPDEGTIYVIAVSGDKYVDQAHRDYVEVGLTGVSTYQTIEIDPRSGRLTYRAWTEEGESLNAFTDRHSAEQAEGGSARWRPKTGPAHRRPTRYRRFCFIASCRAPGEGVDAFLPPSWRVTFPPGPMRDRRGQDDRRQGQEPERPPPARASRAAA